MVVLHVVVVMPTGAVCSGTWSDFAVLDANGSATKKLRPGYVFRAWVPRCARHHSADMFRAQGRMVASQALIDPPMASAEDRIEYLEVAKNIGKLAPRRTEKNAKTGGWTAKHETGYQAQCAFLGLDVKPLQVGAHG